MKRREFVRNMALASLSAPFLVNRLSAQVSPKHIFGVPDMYQDRVLVIIRMNGGNDGLNTIIPIDQYDNLMIQRPNVIIPESQILPATYKIGMHPSMSGMSNLFNDGKLSVVQNVGYPEQNRSHFRSMDIWTTGSMDNTENRGWLGRLFEQDHMDFPSNYPNSSHPDPFAISLGWSLSSTCQGLVSNFSTLVSNPEKNFNLAENEVTNDGTLYGCNLDFVSTLLEQTNLYGERVNLAYDAGSSLSPMYYEGNVMGNDFKSKLAEQLKYVAQMISGGLETKVYVLNVNGFDTHGNQVDPSNTTIGTHADLLSEISVAVEAFQDDLERLDLDHRVMGMTFSEFGRQIASNGSDGTDHGDAAPLLLFGKCISDSVVGENPIIPNAIENQKGVDMQIDFRDVYATVLKDWFRVSEDQLDTIFADHSINYLSLMEGCYNEGRDDKEPIILWPNPSNDWTHLDFYSEGGPTTVNLVDTRGRIIRAYLDKDIEEGRHKLDLDIGGISQGYYLVSISSGKKSRSVSLSIQ